MPSLRIPGQTTNVSDNYATHLARGSLGGTDFTDPYGTPMYAQADGIVTIVDNSSDGSGGRYVRVTYADGESTECLHASSIFATRGQRVSKGQQIGWSGASAFGSNYGTGGPHIHCHGVHANGVRYNVEPYIEWGGSSAPAGGGSSPITNEGDDMPISEAEWGRFEQATRDQTNAQFRDNWLPQIRAAIDASRAVAHTEIAGRIDTKVLPGIADLGGRVLPKMQTAITNAIQRERWRLMNVQEITGVVAVNMATGVFTVYPGGITDARLAKDVAKQKVGSYLNDQGKRVPDNPVDGGSYAEFSEFIDGLTTSSKIAGK